MGQRYEKGLQRFIVVYIALVIALLGIGMLISPKRTAQLTNEPIIVTIPPTEENENEFSYDPISYANEQYIIVEKAWQEYIREHPIPEEFLEASSEDSEEYHSNVNSDEISDEHSNENSDEFSNDNSDECDNVSNGDLLYSADDLFKFEATLYSECGAQGTSYRIQVANAWIARNKIEQEIKNGSENPFRDALNQNHYQGVFDDFDGWRVVSQQEGVITQELIDSNPAIHEICVGVLTGEISSPIYDWDSCICCKTYAFDEVVAIAESLGLNQYFVIENGIFFPSSEWTEEVTQYLQNF